MLWLLLALAQNASLSMPVPDGYRDASTKDAILLMHGAPATDGVAVINVVPGEHHPEDKLGDPKPCAAFAEEMRDHLHANGQSSAIVDGPTGKTCQITLQFKQQGMQSISTIVRGPKDTWILTCTMQPKNTAAVRQCGKTLVAIKFK